MERMNGVSIAAIPKDAPIRVQWTAMSSGTVEVRQARCGLFASTKYPGASADAKKVSAGDSGPAWLPEEREGVLPEGFREANWSAEDLIEFLGISAPFVSWRILAAGLLLLTGLAVFLVIRLISLFFPNKEKKRKAFWFLLAVFCVAVVEAEGSFWLLADMTWIRFLWKAVAGAAVLSMFFLTRMQKEKLWSSVLPGLAAAIAADLVITWAFLPGTALFLLGHVLLIVSFLKKNPMSRTQWIQWAVLSVITSGLIVLVFVPRYGINAWAVTVYAPVLLLMVYSVSKESPRIRHAAGFFLTSDFLLGAFLTVLPDPLAHILCMAMFSAFLMLMAAETGEQTEAS